LQASGSRDKRVGAANVVHIDGARRHAQHHALELLHVQRRSQKRVVERRAKLSLQKECSPWVCSGMRTDIDAGPTNGRQATRASDAGARVEHARHPLGSRVRVLSPLLITPTRPLAGSAPSHTKPGPWGSTRCLDASEARRRHTPAGGPTARSRRRTMTAGHSTHVASTIASSAHLTLAEAPSPPCGRRRGDEDAPDAMVEISLHACAHAAAREASTA
jgi:hypothetical protein